MEPGRAGVEQVITVALIRKSAADLGILRENTGLSGTDLVNRAVTLYEFVDSQLRAGRELVLRDPATGRTWLVELL